MESLLQPTEAFVDWACSWSGINGGNPSAPLWFCGIEFGADGRPFELEPYWEGPRTDGGLEVPAFTDAFVKEHRKVIHTWPYIRKMTKVAMDLDQGWDPRGKRTGWRKYLETRMLRPDGACFHLNLYPIPFHGSRAEWTPKHSELTGLPNVLAYRSWCVAHRFAWLRALAEKHQPRVIVATGRHFVEDFLIAFSTGEITDATDRPLGAENPIGEPRSVYSARALTGDTTLLVTPLFGGRGGLNQNAHLEALVDLVKEELL